MKRLLLLSTIFVTVACGSPQSTESPATEEKKTAQNTTGPLLDSVLAEQSEDHKARYQHRHPKETLEFFGIKPGMSVIEVLPGGGWYSKILLPLIGSKGKLIAVDYPYDMWPNFNFVNDEFLEKRKTWSEQWVTDAKAWYPEKSFDIEAYSLDALPNTLDESVDAALYIRALHNLNRFEDKGQYFTNAVANTYRVLKKGGIVGVVQHQAPEDKADEWANGSRGYLKKSFLIAAFEKAGFSFVGETDVNSNPKDQPSDDDIVWRLPPSYATSGGDEEKKAEFTAIGESNRMTLLFKK